MNSAYIGNMRVASNYPIIVYGSVRGLVSEHRSVRAAYRALKRDRDCCRALGGGAYSDAAVYMFKRGRWLDEDPHDVLFDRFTRANA